MTNTRPIFALGMVLLVTGACIKPVDEQPDSAAGATASAAGTVQPATPVPAAPVVDPVMRIEVDLATRKLYVHRNGAPTDTHSVAVGTEKWPTQTGEWMIKQVVWNPEWVPPTEEEWAEDREPRKPGDPKNPLGVAQLVYDAPRSIHGTNDPASIGKAASHGSIRMRNADIVELAQLVMEAGGAPKDSAWVAETRRNKTTKQIIDLPNPVPIVVR